MVYPLSRSIFRKSKVEIWVAERTREKWWKIEAEGLYCVSRWNISSQKKPIIVTFCKLFCSKVCTVEEVDVTFDPKISSENWPEAVHSICIHWPLPTGTKSILKPLNLTRKRMAAPFIKMLIFTGIWRPWKQLVSLHVLMAGFFLSSETVVQVRSKSSL